MPDSWPERPRRGADQVEFSLKALEEELAALRTAPPWYVSDVGPLTVPPLVCTDEGELKVPEGPGPWNLLVTVSGASPEEVPSRRSKEEASSLAAASRAARLALESAEETLQRARDALKAAEKQAETSQEALSFLRLPSVGTWYVSLSSEGQGQQAKAKAEAAVKEAQEQLASLTDAKSSAIELWEEEQSLRRKAASMEAYMWRFKIRLQFDTDWPTEPPLVAFQSVIHHALLDASNNMQMPFYRSLLRSRKGVFTVRQVLAAIHYFLVDPLGTWGVTAASVPKQLATSMEQFEQENRQRLTTIRKYREKVLHPELFEEPLRLRPEWFDPAVWSAHQVQSPEAWRSVLVEELPGEVFSMNLFTEQFCNLLLEEIFNFYESGLPAKRPNSMNNYGIILDEIGLEPFIDQLQVMLQPLGELLWRSAGSLWDSHHCFIVRYREGEDLGLDMHTDDSDVTFNICLGLEFEGAGLQFCGVMGAANHRRHTFTYHHAKGRCVFHLGRKRHGADDLTKGERLNLILWNHSSTYRASEEYRSPPYVQEEGPPDQVCVSYTHDRDYGLFKPYPAGKSHFEGRGWCPPKEFEYDGFKPDCEVERKCSCCCDEAEC